MRVIAGEFRSRVLKSLHGLDTRPTPDRLREALFNVIAPEIGGSVFLDAYAGTGAVGIEALSRGARHAIFIERARAAVAVIHDNLRTLGIDGRATVIQGKVANHLASHAPDIVFLDPPYEHVREYETAMTVLSEQSPSLVVAQHSTHFALKGAYAALACTREMKQGDNMLSFYRLRAE